MAKVKKFFTDFISQWISRPPSMMDGILLSIFTVLITLQPYYNQGKINLFELGIYLPGIQAILDGQVPFRDFFHLRGPFELYFPAIAMKIFGVHLNVMYLYFFVGNVFCLILCVWILKELLSTRYIFYLAVPVIVARTFPRVVYMIWGGMRYAWGLVVVLCVIKFLKTKRSLWMFWAGLATAMGLFTSVEIGAYAIFGVGTAAMVAFVLKTFDRSLILKAAFSYVFGCSVIAVPFIVYMISQQAFFPYMDATLSVVTNMQNTFDPHLVSIYPHNLKDAVVAMTNFVHTNFKHMTPSYLYLILSGYLLWRLVKRNFGPIDLCLLFLGVYGFIMYNTGFRGIWASQFEMALMPEKILYFFILERALLALWLGSSSETWKKYAFRIFVFVLLASSLGYAIQRFNHRFVAFKLMTHMVSGKDTKHLMPLSKEPFKSLTFDRAKGVVVPLEQADELEAIVHFLETETSPADVIFTYPELGIYNFFSDRPFLGRFPIVTFSWMNSKWHRELVEQLKSGQVKCVILQKNVTKDWTQVYLGPQANREKYDELMGLIRSGFVLKTETPLSYIYQSKTK